MERIPALVLLVVGEGPEAKARVLPDGSDGPETVDAALVSAGTGIEVGSLPGRRVVALVEGGELVGFEAA